MKKLLLVSSLIAALAAVSAFGQETEPDPEIQEAKEATVVVYDLGRFFGYVHTMVTEDTSLELSGDQLKTFYDIMKEIQSTDRIEPEWAEETLDYLELDVLSPSQLMEVDQLALAREESREEGTGTSQGGGGTGTGPLQTFVAGGAFNPIIDETKSIGEGFFELYRLVEKKLGY